MPITDGGIYIPSQPPEPTHYGPLELDDPEDRETVGRTLAKLWLQAGMMGANRFDSAWNEAHKMAWRYLATMLLGDDVPDVEEYT